MSEIRLVLQYPPSINHYWEHKAVRSRRTRRWVVLKYLSQRAREFRRHVIEAVIEQLKRAPQLRDRLAVEVHEFYGPVDEAHDDRTSQSQDIDNCLKPLFDAMEHAKVYTNDSQIDQLLVVKRRRAAIGRVEVYIRPLGDKSIWS